MANANGATPDQLTMTSLMESAKTTPGFLLAAGAVMIIATATSKKAQNVIKTSVDLSVRTRVIDVRRFFCSRA